MRIISLALYQIHRPCNSLQVSGCMGTSASLEVTLFSFHIPVIRFNFLCVYIYTHAHIHIYIDNISLFKNTLLVTKNFFKAATSRWLCIVLDNASCAAVSRVTNDHHISYTFGIFLRIEVLNCGCVYIILKQLFCY